MVGHPPSTLLPVPPSVTPPPSGVGGCSIAAGRSSRLAPRHAASPSSGVAGEPAGHARLQPVNPSPPPTSRVSPTWAGVVRGGVGSSVGEPAVSRPLPPVTAADFSALYGRCLENGLKARVSFNHAAGQQTVTLTCFLSDPSTSAATAGRGAAAAIAVLGAAEPPPTPPHAIANLGHSRHRQLLLPHPARTLIQHRRLHHRRKLHPLLLSGLGKGVTKSSFYEHQRMRTSFSFLLSRARLRQKRRHRVRRHRACRMPSRRHLQPRQLRARIL